MANPKINISSLDFDGIKTSLKGYLSTRSDLNGYDFEGSGINLLLDILAYNTLYYGFYSNMIANETFLDTAQIENNIVSLVKPLGYLVSGKSSSKTQVTLTSAAATGTLIPYSSYFIGTSTSGTAYRFYPVADENISLQNGEQTQITLYEGKSVVNDLQVTVDIAEQKAFLGTIDVDLDTVRVKVITDGVETVWTKFNNIAPAETTDSTVYFIDRTSSGFYLVFGRRTLNDYQAYFGKDIGQNDIVKVSYIVPSGSKANNIASFTNATINVISSTRSDGGKDSVDLDLVKFFAPKLFAANDRAVTKDDYYGLLLNSNLLPENITTKEQLNVWGGEEASPPSYGRVFVSFADTTLTATNHRVKRCLAFVKNKSVVSVLPEYVQPQVMNVNLNITAYGSNSSQRAGIKSLLESTFNSPKIFNKSVTRSEIKSLITDQYPTIQRVDISSANMQLVVVGSGSEKIINFRNEIDTTEASITSTNFSYGGKTDASLYNKTGSTDLITKNYLFGLGTIGEINYTSGIISVNSGVISQNTQITVTAKPKYPDNIVINNEFLVNLTVTVSGG